MSASQILLLYRIIIQIQFIGIHTHHILKRSLPRTLLNGSIHSASIFSLVIFLQRKTVHILEVLSMEKIQGQFGNLLHAESFSASVPHQNHGTQKNDFFSVLPRKEQSQYHARRTGESLIYYILYSHILHHKCLCWKSQRPPPGLMIHLEDTQDSAHSPTHGYGLLQ